MVRRHEEHYKQRGALPSRQWESGPGLWQLHRLLSALTPRRGGWLGWRGDPAVPLPFVVWLRCNASGLSWFRCSSSIWLRGRECAGPPRVTRFDGAARWAYDGLPVFQQALTAENELSATGPFESRDDLSEVTGRDGAEAARDGLWDFRHTTESAIITRVQSSNPPAWLVVAAQPGRKRKANCLGADEDIGLPARTTTVVGCLPIHAGRTTIPRILWVSRAPSGAKVLLRPRAFKLQQGTPRYTAGTRAGGTGQGAGPLRGLK
ncbi:hypothetical protein NDU88_005168 [Pleurodeles waltl]|uniref:Uncharacterized protein n=1 Tax=Pleurodeles waltl TaxID=8319 RepID=A0AAV7LNH4_PLEWA|nr:hypothetical protein NDU88_005168 [Pleurodeles waltl]